MKHLAIGFLFLLGWILPPFWSLATFQAVNVQDDIYTSDLLNDRQPARAFVGRSLRDGDSPLWAPGIYTGFPIFAAVETGALYPTNLLLFTLLDPDEAIAWAQLVPLLLAGFGAFLLAREYGLPLAPCLLTAGSFALCGFLVAHLRQLNMVDAAAWIPFLLLLVERRLQARGRSTLPLLALCWSLQLLAGHPQISYFTGLIVAAYFFARCRGRFAREAGSIAAAIFVGTLLAGVVLAPGFELASLSQRGAGLSFDKASNLAVSPRATWGFLIPYLHGDAGSDDFTLPGIFWEQYGYLGLAPVMLALGALALGWRKGLVRLLGGIVVVSWLMVLGPATPLFEATYHWLPGMSFFRFPTRFLVFVDLALALLAGFGLAFVLERVRTARRRAALASVLLVWTAVDLWSHQLRQVPLAPMADWRAPVSTAQYLGAQLEAADEPWRVYTLDAPFVHAATFHAAGGWAGDLTPFVQMRSLLQPSSNLLFGLDSPSGYANLPPHYYESVWGSDKGGGLVRPSGGIVEGKWGVEPRVTRLLRLFNVRWVISAFPLVSDDLGPATVFPERFGIQEVVDPLPRAFVVGRARAVASDAEALTLLGSEEVDLAAEALLHDAPADLPPNAQASRAVRIEARSNTRLKLRSATEAPGLLVVSEGYYPGWRATIDGQTVEILRANMMMRALRLPAGDHEIVFEFHPRSLAIGLAVSLTGVLGLAILVAVARGQKPVYPGGRQPLS